MKVIATVLAVLAAVVLVLIVVAGGWWQDATAYETYTNDRYSYEVDYPARFTAAGESQNGDGQIFTGENATIRVFGIENTADDPLATIAEQYLETSGSAVTTVEDSPTVVTLRADVGGEARVVKVIRLPDTAVGVLEVTATGDALTDNEISTILASFHSTDSVSVNGDTGQDGTDEESDGSGGIPVGYRLYQSSELEFSILAPREATVSDATEDRIQFTFLGPDNEPNTEIRDGFTVTVFRDTLDENYASTQAYAEAVVEETRAGDENQITGELEARQVNGMPAYRFSYTGALGTEVTTYVFLPDDSDEGYQVTYGVMDPNARGYESIVFTMLESVRFRDEAASGPPTFDSVDLAMLDYEASGDQYTNESDGMERGCDRVVMVDRGIEPTTAPLTAALRQLFALETDTYGGWQNFIAETNDTLSFDRARVEDGTAHIYLTGELSGLSGVCDNPRARIQIEETALQFATVDDVQLYLDEEETDLQPDGQGN